MTLSYLYNNLTYIELHVFNGKYFYLFFILQSLKWLDLKDNPLEAGLAKAAGDCLDEKQCKQCSSKVTETRRSIIHFTRLYFKLKVCFSSSCLQVLQHMREIQDEVDRVREKRLLREKGLYQEIF